MVECESTSGTAPEGGVLSMEELGEIVTGRQKLSVTDEVELSEEMWLEELEETPSDPGELEDLICDPMEVPPTISHHFSILHVLDLSYTEIKSLPQSISRLVALQKLFLRSCEHLMELPPEIGELTNLEVLDLEGTEILCLPKEIAKLVNLTCLKVSFYGYASQTVQKVIPRRVLSNLSHLIELIIDVSPYGEWWDFEVEAIIDDLRSLKQLETLKLYLPTTTLLEELKCMFPGLPNFRFTVGRHEEHFISRLPHNVEEEFNNLEKGLKYMNGSHIPNEITKVFKPNAFFLQRHWTAKSLSDFGHENINEVKFCLVMECNEFRTIIDSEQFYQGKDAIVLGSLERLIIRYLKNVESIWKGPVGKGSLSNLKSLVVFTCPNLTTLLTIDMLGNLSNLEKLIVEDCPKIESVVSLKSSGSKSDLFLPSLKKISLIDVPELVSISDGLRIAPKLERLVILYCPKLEKLCTKEVSSTELKVIKGEKEWWDALKWYESDLSTKHGDYLASLFIPLRRDGDLMARLTKDEISGYGQGKVGSFNIRDPPSLFSEEEHLEEISLEESEETPSNPREILGSVKDNISLAQSLRSSMASSLNSSQNNLCKNCKRPGHYARECPNVAICHNCGLPGHIASECSTKSLCWNCREPGHMAGSCPNEGICHTCGKAGHHARDCSTPPMPPGDLRLCNNCFKQGHILAECTNEKACKNCRKTGHLARDCSNDPVCNLCNVVGHLARACPKANEIEERGGGGRGGGGGGGYRDIICRSCHQPGHMSRDCPGPLMICHNCGGRGHIAYECPSGRFMDRYPSGRFMDRFPRRY